MDGIFTTTSLFSLLGVSALAGVAYTGAQTLLPKNASKTDRYTFMWLAFDAMIHFSFEGSWLYLSVLGRQVNTSVGPFAEMWREYAAADYRWGVSDPLWSPWNSSPFWAPAQCAATSSSSWFLTTLRGTIGLCWMTFCPEWLTGSENLNTSNPLYLWVYLFFMNVIWVLIPIWLMVESYSVIAKSVRATHLKVKAA
ncbi:Emopamil-binding protein [Mucidula mucida]|nr:Emopamil-binding protein [Mucidula mucida]